MNITRRNFIRGCFGALIATVIPIAHENESPVTQEDVIPDEQITGDSIICFTPGSGWKRVDMPD